MRFWRWVFPLLMMAGLVWATDTVPTSPTSSDREQVVRQRTQERWNALIRKDWTAAYSFEAPVFRAARSLEQYQGEFGKDIVWKAATVDRILFEGDEVATVYVNLQYQMARLIAGEAPTLETLVAEKWIRADDAWWHVPSRQSL